MPQLDIKAMEKKWQAYWQNQKIYKFNPNSKSPIFSIDTPPPTVSGEMHVGHAFSYSQEDFIARYKRMSGNEVFYPFGTDDNGLPTERLIEKLKNVKSKSLPRSEFISLCIQTLKEITPAFIQDWKNLAISCDFDIYYSTISPIAQKISQASFIELYKKGHIYKDKFPTIFCPECQTPVAQAELEDKSLPGLFTTLKFTSNSTTIPIATTRPELLAACVAVFVNPKDERYKSLIGKKARVPLFNHLVPILSDPSAQIDKGTGILMICSYGDKYDVDAIKRLSLQPKIIFNQNGTLNIPDYQNLTIKQARKKILEELKNKNLIIKQESIHHSVNTHDKCGTEIEFLPVEQWFIKILDKKSQLLKQGEKISWHPPHMLKRYQNWISGLEWDWSISRDRHFGIPIPVWECQKCNQILLPKESELPIDPSLSPRKCTKCKSEALGETKVLDTWATSSLTPQIASALVKNKIKLPYSLRPQAHDIIRTWAFYTIIKSLLHESKIPWKDIAISGFVKLEGEKMSKSKGNVIKPQILMDQFGSDALRYAAASLKLGDDANYNEKDLVTGKKFITKILNASNFVFMNLKPAKSPSLLETDRLLLSQLNSLIQETTNAFENYNYLKAKISVDSFFWKTFADNYLEIIKNRIYNGTPQEKASASYTLYHSLLTILKLFSPITPYITEEIYQTHFKKTEKDKSIHISHWPKQFKIKHHKSDNEIWNKLIEIISKVRHKKSEANKSMKAEISLTLPKSDQSLLKPLLPDLQAVTNAQEINEGPFQIKIL